MADVDNIVPACQTTVLKDPSVISTQGGETLNDDFPDVESDLTDDLEPLPDTPKRRICQTKIFFLVFSSVVVGGVVAVMFGTGAVGGSSSGISSVNKAQDSASSPAMLHRETQTSTDPLLATLKSFSNNGLDDPDSSQWRAYQWMANDDPLTTAETDSARLKQRYALATLYAALADEMPAFATQEECAWPTVACGTQNFTADWQVTEIDMANQSFTGTIPPEIELLAPSLLKLDMAENPKLHGSIPEELYNLVKLKYIFLYHNAMTGTLSESFDKMQLLEDVYLGNNAFTGPIPDSLGSRQDIRPLRYLSFHHNQMTGSIPEGMALRHAFYVDLSFNKFSGTLPRDIGDDFVRLRHLYLDHNEFTGPIPESYALAGDGHLINLYLSDNILTGSVPSGWIKGNKDLNAVTVQNNDLTEAIDENLCKLAVLDGGEMVELSADCTVCSCKTLCDLCF